MAKVIWSELALEDIRSIHDYISKDSVTYADKQIDRLISRVERLEKFTKLGRVVPEFQRDDLRELIEGSYRIVYKVYSDDSIGIARIHHSAKPLQNI